MGESKKALRAALKRKDPELLHDIDREIRGALRGAHYEYDEDLSLDYPSVASAIDWDEIAGTVLNEGPGDLPLPDELLKEHLKDELVTAVDYWNAATRGNRVNQQQGQLFKIDEGSGIHHISHPSYEISVRAPVVLTHFMTEKEIAALLKDEVDADFEADDDWFRSGWIEDQNQQLSLHLRKDQVEEWLVDKYRAYLDDLIGAEPDVAIAELFRILEAQAPELKKKIKKAKLPKDVLLSYAGAYFESPEDGLELLAEAVGSWGYEGSRGEPILEVTKEDLRNMGITQGAWWDGAPWLLLNLPVRELAYEGTLQRHCVGRFDMGYREAVANGETEIWSLRSRFNKPVLTFEVTIDEWKEADAHEEKAKNDDVWRLSAEEKELAREGAAIRRATAITQLKGKLNRIAGTEEEEAKVLLFIFEILGVNPKYVEDFARRSRNPMGFDRPFVPYHARRRDELLE